MNNLRRVIVDFKKLTPEVLKLLVEKYPDGYGDGDVINFKGINGESIEAVEVTTVDAKYLVKISSKLERSMANFEDSEDEVLNTDDIEKIPDSEFSSSEEEE